MRGGAVLPLDPGYGVGAAFLNVTVAKPTKNGYVTAYLPDTTRPNASTVNFTAGQNLSNAAFTPLAEVLGAYAVRIYASQTTDVVIDLTGAVVGGGASNAAPGGSPANSALERRRAGQQKLARRLRPAAR